MTAPEPLDLDAIRKRVEAAAEGPWFAFSDNDGGRSSEILVVTNGANEDEGLVLTWGSGVNKANAEFIAHARTDIPALLAELDRLQRALSQEQDARKEIVDTVSEWAGGLISSADLLEVAEDWLPDVPVPEWTL